MSNDYFKLGNMHELKSWLKNTDYFTAPASTKYHGCKVGGLYEHSLTVAELLVNWTDKLKLVWQDKRSPYVIGLLHDVCKINNYVFDVESNCWKYNPNFEHTNDHGSLSVKMIEEHGFLLNEEEKACILFHMGAWTKDGGDMTYSQAIEKYHNVLWVHTADMYASQILKK